MDTGKPVLDQSFFTEGQHRPLSWRHCYPDLLVSRVRPSQLSLGSVRISTADFWVPTRDARRVKPEMNVTTFFPLNLPCFFLSFFERG